MNQSTIVSTVIRGIRLSIASALLVLLAGLLTMTQAARAATYVVTNSNNSGPGSLRQAINGANDNPGPDTINFAAETDGNPIILAGAVAEDGNASGDLDILDGGDLTVQGNGTANTLIDGNEIDRVFHVCPGGGCTNTVTFTGMTIRNGDADHGGGILNENATTTVEGSIVSANTATHRGGGIYNVSGTTTLVGSTIAANTAQTGGGIHNNGTLNVQNGSIIGGVGAGNLATHGGGGIYNFDSGMTTVNDSTVSANTANSQGGGIDNRGTLNVQNGSTVSDNEAHGGGGGIFNEYGTTTVDGSTVSANTTQLGGGIFNEHGTTTVDGSTVSANDAIQGGGIHNSCGGTTTVESSTVSANDATHWGGGIYNSCGGTTTVDDSFIGGTGAGNTAGEFGGGIYNYDGTTTVDGSTINANTAGKFGGGIYNFNGAATVDDSTVSDNMASSDGGGIYNRHTPIAQNGGTTIVSGSRILNNTAANNGGGVYSDSSIGGATSVTGSCIVGNSAMSHFNSQIALLIATGNWWGAATGPNTPGADTVGGIVDVSGYLTTPILGCAPDLQVGKANDTGGNGEVGIPFNWTLTVSNTGLIRATFGAAQTILKDELPAGPRYGAPLTGSFVDVANSANK